MTATGMDTAVAALRNAGLMPTRERVLVAGLVFSAPLISDNVEDVRERALDQGLPLSRDEVRQTLSELRGAGVLPVMFSGKKNGAAALLHAADILQAMGNTHRLAILMELCAGERSVGALRDVVGLRPSALSQHLAKLRMAGLVQTRRDATRIYYSLSASEIPAVLRGLGLAGKSA